MALNTQTPTGLPVIQAPNLASAAGSVALDRAQTVVIPEIPKDAFKSKAPDMWLVIALIELAIIGWLTYKLKRLKKA